MLHIVNSQALAEFTGYAINLYAGSNATDLYHEAWHGFSQLYLSKEEKIALYQEVKKLTGVKTFKEAEEFLAEDFRLFAMSGGKKSVVKGKVKQNIFQTIWNILKGWFGNKNYTELQQEFTSEEIIRSYMHNEAFQRSLPGFDNSSSRKEPPVSAAPRPPFHPQPADRSGCIGYYYSFFALLRSASCGLWRADKRQC